MKTLKIPPGASRLITSLRGLGYECKTAIADLIDNSISADCSEIYVDIIPGSPKKAAALVIIDNGDGMDREELIEAMRFGSNQVYSGEDLGKFGLGLKTASISQCKILTVSSKPKKKSGKQARKSTFRWDLNHVFKVNEWSLQALDDQDLDKWELDLTNHQTCKNHGTVVIWKDIFESLPDLTSSDDNKRNRCLSKTLMEVSDHLRMVFHKFMQNQVSGRRKLKIRVGDHQLDPWDPFCISERYTKALQIHRIQVSPDDGTKPSKTDKVVIAPYILPNESHFSSKEAWREASGSKNWNQRQGFYIYRNGRLLQAGGWSYLRTPDEHTKYLRIAIDFPSTLDKSFSINVTKMRALIPAQIRDELKSEVTEWIKEARSKYSLSANTNKGKSGGKNDNDEPNQKVTKASTSPTVKFGGVEIAPSNVRKGDITVSAGASRDVKIVIPYDHDLSDIFNLSAGKYNDTKKVCLLLMSIVEATAAGKLIPSKIPLEPLRKLVKKHV